jgi:hypothetical protein
MVNDMGYIKMGLRIVVQWWALVNMVRESLGSIKAGNFLTG